MPNTFAKISISQKQKSAENPDSAIPTRVLNYYAWFRESSELYGQPSGRCLASGRRFATDALIEGVSDKEDRRRLLNLLRRFWQAGEGSDDSAQPLKATISQPASNTAQPPVGAVGKVFGSDQKWHWTDGQNDLGVVEEVA